MARFGFLCLHSLVAVYVLIQGLELQFVFGTCAPVPAVVFIGASQSDVGVNNEVQASLARANFLPYGRDFVNGDQKGPTGRFSNGKILPDFIAEKLGLPFPLPYNSPKAKGLAVLQGINTASAGSGWLNDTNANLGVVPGTEQVQWVKKWQQSLVSLVGPDKAWQIVRKSIYVINIGDNDLLGYLQSTTLQKQYSEEEFRQLVINTAVANIQDLYAAGARKFAVTSASSRGCSPLSITQNQPLDRTECVEDIQTFVQKYNTEYEVATQNLEDSLQGSEFFFAHTFDITRDLFKNPSKYGFQNTGIACCGTGTFETGPLCNSLTPGTCSDASEYLYFDSVHYTSKAWKIIVNSFFDSLKASILT